MSGARHAVGLDSETVLQTSRTDGQSPHALFAKTALMVRAGTTASVSLPPDWAARAAVTWGTNGALEWTTNLTVPACRSSAEPWLVFPGGVQVDAPACVPLIIRTGEKSTVVHLSVGVRCPG